MKKSETKGAEPNYRTLHCVCGNGFIWRIGTDEETREIREAWVKERQHGRCR